MRETVEITVAGRTIAVPINLDLCARIEAESGAASFVDTMIGLQPEGARVSATATRHILRAALTAAGESLAILDDVKPMEAAVAAAKIGGALLKSLAPEDGASPPGEAAAASV